MNFPGVMHFRSEEFDSPDLPGSGGQMQLNFVRMLDSTRALCGFPFKVDSGFRTLSHNKAVGGETNSAHMYGNAADIHAADSRSRFLIVQNAIKVGFTRIGIGGDFVHLDNSPALDQQVIWLYPATAKRS